MKDMKIIVEDRIRDITPEILAELFAEMDQAEQARFFNHIDKVASLWTQPFCFQLQAITDDDGLTLAGRRVMQEIGEYSHWGLVPSKWKLDNEHQYAMSAENER